MQREGPGLLTGVDNFDNKADECTLLVPSLPDIYYTLSKVGEIRQLRQIGSWLADLAAC